MGCNRFGCSHGKSILALSSGTYGEERDLETIEAIESKECACSRATGAGRVARRLRCRGSRWVAGGARLAEVSGVAWELKGKQLRRPRRLDAAQMRYLDRGLRNGALHAGFRPNCGR